MTAKVLNVRRLERSVGSEIEALTFTSGVNVMVGNQNAGKTSWLKTLDYLFGDSDSVEKALGTVLATKYDRAKLELSVDEVPLVLERRWTEKGGKGKVYVNGDPMPAGDVSGYLLSALNIPRVQIPKGNPYGDNTWPELSWRILLRHIFRQEFSWSELVERQPEAEQHAVVLLLTGAAGDVFSPEYNQLVQAQRDEVRLDAQKANFEETVQDVARELVSVDQASAGFTTDALIAAIKQIDEEILSMQRQRDAALARLRGEAQEKAGAQYERQASLFEQLGGKLDAARTKRLQLQADIERSRERAGDLSGHLQTVKHELAKQERAQAAGDLLGSLKVTHCPVCDRSIARKPVLANACGLCEQPYASAEIDKGSSERFEFERQQLTDESTELEGLISKLHDETTVARRSLRDVDDEISQLEQLLSPVRVAAAWVIPEEFSAAEHEIGRLEEKRRQLQRISSTLSRRDELAKRLDSLRQEAGRLKAVVETKKAEPQFAELGDKLGDAMNDYLNALDENSKQRWEGRVISVILMKDSWRILVNGKPWRHVLGAHFRAYLFLAYHYALLKLSRTEPFTYPGFCIIDFPQNLSQFGISDQENYLLMPFVSLLKSKELQSLQLIAAGRAFAGLEGAHRIDISPSQIPASPSST